MRSSFALALALVASLAAPDARAQDDEVVHLLPLVAETKLRRDKALLKEADEGLREGALEALGDRADIASRARSARCVSSPRCVGKLAKRADASQGAAFLLKEGEGDALRVVYLVASAGGDVLLSGERVYARDALADGLRKLVRELLVPASLSGTLKVPGVDDAAWVTVDGVPVGAAALDAGLAMGLGEHEVVLLRQGAEAERHVVEVAFGEETVVAIADAPPPPEPEVIIRMPLWPTLVGAGATASFLGVTVMFLLDAILAGTQALGPASAVTPRTSDSDLFPAQVARQPALLKARRAMQSDLLIAGVAAAGMVVAAACTAALATAWGLSAANEEAPASNGEPDAPSSTDAPDTPSDAPTGDGPADDAPDAADAAPEDGPE